MDQGEEEEGEKHSPEGFQGKISMKIERLTREAFAPFGDLISLAGAQHYPINDGTTERFHDLAAIDVSDVKRFRCPKRFCSTR